jgi:hypothetical protein
VIPQTAAVLAFFLMLALSRRSGGAAVGVVIASMMLWPEYLRIPMGLAAMSVPRLIAIALLIKFMGKGLHRKINFGKIDKLVLSLWIWSILATALAGADAPQQTEIIGKGFDTVLMYFVARIAIRGPKDLPGLYVGLAISAVVLGIVGAIETNTTQSPYSSMSGYTVWTSQFEKGDEFRYGFLRAKGSTATHIYFGMAMMVILGMLWALREYAGMKFFNLVSIPAAVIAALSSMSSGPWLGCIELFVINSFVRRVSLIRPALKLIVLAFVAMELLSNRHFYNLIDYIALDPATAWYRTRLLEVAVSQWRDYWIVGVGSDWPHHWAALVDGRQHIDVVNHFLIVALSGGIPAAFMYISTHVIAVRMVINAWRDDSDNARRQLLFGMAATLVALDISSMSVGLFGPVLLLSNILLGATVSLAIAWKRNDVDQNMSSGFAPRIRKEGELAVLS